jgi:trehalose-phosphatase
MKSATLPSALEALGEIAKQAKHKEITVFLDYDGTLTPIVDTPDKAILSDRMRQTVVELSNHCTVGVISGRDLKDVQDKVKIDSIVYAGSHGFDIAGPSGLNIDSQVGDEFLPSLGKAEKTLADKLGGIQGVALERKKYALAVHYRLADPDQTDAIEKAVDEAVEQFSDLRKARGKKIFELQPKMNWHKGKALF